MSLKGIKVCLFCHLNLLLLQLSIFLFGVKLAAHYMKKKKMNPKKSMTKGVRTVAPTFSFFLFFFASPVLFYFMDHCGLYDQFDI